MGFLRIHCHNCGGYWDINEGDDFNHPKYKKCPHCKKGIDGQDYFNTVLPAFGAMMDANKELYKTHTGYSAPLFTVEYKISDDNENDAKNDVLELADSIETLRDAVDQLTNAITTVEFIRKYS